MQISSSYILNFEEVEEKEVANMRIRQRIRAVITFKHNSSYFFVIILGLETEYLTGYHWHFLLYVF